MDGGQDQEHEVVENALNAMESFVSRCSKDIAPHFDELCTVLKALLAYDPNVYAMDDAGDDDDEFEADFDDDVVDSEDDDNSWKVRRSSWTASRSARRTCDWKYSPRLGIWSKQPKYP